MGRNGFTIIEPKAMEVDAEMVLDPNPNYDWDNCLDVRRLASLEPSSPPGISVTTGLLSSFLLLSGFLAYRCMRRFQAKPEPRRDSFGFLSDSRRTSFTHGEKMV